MLHEETCWRRKGIKDASKKADLEDRPQRQQTTDHVVKKQTYVQIRLVVQEEMCAFETRREEHKCTRKKKQSVAGVE